MSTRKPVFEVPLTDDNYGEIRYADGTAWKDHDKKLIRSFVLSSHVAMSTDISGQAELETENGKLLIRFETHPDPKKSRFKKIEGFWASERNMPAVSAMTTGCSISCIESDSASSPDSVFTKEEARHKLQVYQLIMENGQILECEAISWKRRDDLHYFLGGTGELYYVPISRVVGVLPKPYINCNRNKVRMKKM